MPFEEWLGDVNATDRLKTFYAEPTKYFKRNTDWYFRSKNHMFFDIGWEKKEFLIKFRIICPEWDVSLKFSSISPDRDMFMKFSIICRDREIYVCLQRDIMVAMGFNDFLRYDVNQADNDAYVDQAIQEMDQHFTLILLTDFFDESLILMKHLLCWDWDDIVYIKFKMRTEEAKAEVRLSHKIFSFSTEFSPEFEHVSFCPDFVLREFLLIWNVTDSIRLLRFKLDESSPNFYNLIKNLKKYENSENWMRKSKLRNFRKIWKNMKILEKKYTENKINFKF